MHKYVNFQIDNTVDHNFKVMFSYQIFVWDGMGSGIPDSGKFEISLIFEIEKPLSVSFMGCTRT